MNKKFVFLTAFFVVFCTAMPLFAQLPNADSAFIRDHFIKKELMIPMRDGVRLFTSVYVPKDTFSTYPILLKRTPYSC